MSVYELLACLYVGLPIPRAYLLNYTYMSDLRQIFVRFSVRGSVLLWRCCDAYFHCVHQFANSSSVQFMCCEQTFTLTSPPTEGALTHLRLSVRLSETPATVIQPPYRTDETSEGH